MRSVNSNKRFPTIDNLANMLNQDGRYANVGSSNVSVEEHDDNEATTKRTYSQVSRSKSSKDNEQSLAAKGKKDNCHLCILFIFILIACMTAVLVVLFTI